MTSSNFKIINHKRDRLSLDTIPQTSINYGFLGKYFILGQFRNSGNFNSFLTKALRKAIMLRTRLRNMYNKCRTKEKWNAFRKQRNKCVKILRTEKVDYYRNLDWKDISDNRKFWKTVKPLFSDKIQTPGSITLLKGDEQVSDDKKVAEILNEYFVNITASLEISGVEENLVKTNEVSDPIDIDVNMYKRHPSIQLIKQRVTVSEKFSFQQVSLEQISSQFKNLDPTKASPFGSIPVKMLTEHSDLFAPLIQLFINESIDTSNFPKELKKGDITPSLTMVMPLQKELQAYNSLTGYIQN